MTGFKERPEILIVEDEVIIAADLERALASMGYTVCGITGTAEQAIEIVGRQKPDLVMMDIILQGDMEGVEAAETIRDKWGIPVVFLTAYADTDHLEKAKLAYPFGYLLKPFQEKDLKITLEMALYAARVDKERQKAEQQLRESEERFRSITEQMAETVFLTDQEGLVLYMSPVAEDIFGFRTDEMVGRHFMQFLEENSIEHAVSEFMQTLESGVATRNIRLRMKRKDGSIFFGELSASIYRRRGAIAGTIGLIRDITSQQKADEALRESEETLQVMMDAMPQAAFLMTTEGIVLAANANTKKRLALNSDELIGKCIYDLLPPDVAERRRGYSMQAKRTGESVRFEDEREGVYVDSHIQPIRDETGKVYRLAILGIDITERKLAEKD